MFFALLNLGLIATAAGIALFKTPNHFAFGGTSGLSIVLATLFPRFNVGAFMWVVNAVLVVLGFIFLGIRSMGWTIYSSFALSFYVSAFEWAVPLREPLTNDVFLELCYAMLLSALGSALMFDKGASSGGTDIVALILKKHTSMNVGKALLAVDSLIAVSSFFVFDIQTGLFSLLGLFAKAFLVDSIIESINSFKYFVVITEKGDEVSEYIIKTLHHGVTVNEAVGAFTHTQKYMIHTVCRRIEAIRLKKEIKKIDEHSFVIITTTSEIVGRGFRGV